MKTVINYDKDKLETEGLPEYIRDAETSSREQGGFGSRANHINVNPTQSPNYDFVSQSQRDTGGFARIPEPAGQYGYQSQAGAQVSHGRSDELEALWPGFHQDFMQTPKRNPSFYMMLGFMAGAFASMLVVWGFSAVSGMMPNSSATAKPTQVAQVTTSGAATTAQSTAPVATPQGGDPNKTVVPKDPTVEVQAGDTLAAIAIREYGRCSPRLLDTIVKANGMKNGNFLQLGQKLNLPNYQPSVNGQAGATAVN